MNWQKADERIMTNTNSPEEITVELLDEMSCLFIGAGQHLAPIIIAALDTMRDAILNESGIDIDMCEDISNALRKAILVSVKMSEEKEG